MKKLLILLLPALMLVGCGQMDSNESTVGAVTNEMADNGHLSNESQADLDNLNDPSLLDETVTLTETSDSSLMMKVGGVELLVDFIDQLDIVDDDAIAMIINGIEVTQAIANDPSQLKGLLASIVSSATQGIDIFGFDLGKLVSVGLDLISGNLNTSDLSSIFGTLVQGALSMFLSSVPFGGLIGALAGPVIDSVLGNNNSGQDSGSASSNSGLGGLGDAVSSIIGSLTGGSSTNSGSSTNNNNSSSSNDSSNGGSLFNGIFNLITNLF